MQLKARVFDPARSFTGWREVEARDLAAGRATLEAQGMVVLDLQTRGAGLDVRGWLRFKRNTFDVRLVCVELSALLRAGLGLSEALESLASRTEDRAADVYRELVEWLLQGQPLSEAMQRSGRPFPAILVAAVRASERTGRVADALDEFSRFDGAVRELRRKAVSAAVYPMVVIGFGALVALFLLGYVVPRFASIYDDTAVNMSGATRVILFIGRTVSSHGIEIAIAAVVLLIGVLRVAMDVELRSRMLIVMFSRGPLASFARLFQLQRICQSLAMLLRGGYALPQALKLARALALQPALQNSLAQATQAVEEGRATSVAWSDAGLGDEFARRILQAGERAGELSIGFDTLAATYARTIETTMERSARLIEPLLLMLVASLIGTIVVLMYMPIFDLAGTIQ